MLAKSVFLFSDWGGSEQTCAGPFTVICGSE